MTKDKISLHAHITALLNAYNKRDLHKIKKVYRTAIKALHPDSNDNNKDNSTMTVILNTLYSEIICCIKENRSLNINYIYSDVITINLPLKDNIDNRSNTAYRYISEGFKVMNRALEELRFSYTGRDKHKSNARICRELLKALQIYSVVIRDYNDTEWVIDAESKLKWINKISYNLSRRFEN